MYIWVLITTKKPKKMTLEKAIQQAKEKSNNDLGNHFYIYRNERGGYFVSMAFFPKKELMSKYSRGYKINA